MINSKVCGETGGVEDAAKDWTWVMDAHDKGPRGRTACRATAVGVAGTLRRGVASMQDAVEEAL